MAEYKKNNKADETDEEILEYVRNGLKECIDEEESERTKMRDDLRFCTLDQWPADIRNERENDKENGPRPCLTIDKINQYIVQVCNDARQGKPGINVRPQDDYADVETAKILKGLVRNIEDQSSADIAYAGALESAAKIGVGYFRITTEYVSEDSFDQEIFIRPVANAFSVYLSKHVMPDGSDAERGYIAEAIPIAKFKEMYPKAKAETKDFDGLDPTIAGFWKSEETVTVVEEFCIKSTAQTLHYLADGTTITDEDYTAWPEEAGVRPSIQDSRTSVKKQLKWRKCTAVEVLEKQDLPGKYIPIVEVIGRETWVDGKRVVWGLVRPAKDSLRMYNYWASTITERMALAPKQPYVAAVGQIEGREQEWKTANKTNRSVLLYNPVDVNGNALPAPKREGPVQMEAALLQQMQVIEHDVQTSLGMFKAAVGESESQQSGRAILALQRESDTSTYHFGANLGVSIRHAGRIIVDLIPHYYDTKRVVRILGEDGEVKTAQIDPEQEMAHRQVQSGGGILSIFNPGVGKYDVSITVGPSYNTKRMEAAATFVEMAKGAADPASAATLRYLTMRNSDTAGSEEASRLLKALLPPQVLQAMDGGAPVPPQAQAQMAQMQQQIQAMAEGGAKLQGELQKAKAGTEAKVMQTQADHDAKMKELELQRQVEAEKARLAREKADAEFELKKLIAQHDAALEEEKCQREDARAEKKLEMERAQMAQDNEFKRQEQAKTDEATAMPNFMKAFEGMLKVVQQIVEDNQRFQAAIVQQMQNPPKRTISLGNIKRGEGGITGATATVQ